MISFSSFFEQYLCSVLHDRQETAFELSESLLNLRNSGQITLAKKVKFKLHLNVDCKFMTISLSQYSAYVSYFF